MLLSQLEPTPALAPSSSRPDDPAQAKGQTETTPPARKPGGVDVSAPVPRTEVIPPEGFLDNAYADEEGRLAELDFDHTYYPALDDLSPQQSLLGSKGLTLHVHPLRSIKPGRVVTGEFWQPNVHYRDAIVARLRHAGRLDLSEPLAACHQDPVYARCTACHRVQVFTKRCDRHYCPLCQPSLTFKRLESVAWWADRINEPKHIILTVKNVPDFARGHLDELKRWLAKLRRNSVTRRTRFWRVKLADGSYRPTDHWHRPTATHKVFKSTPWKGGLYSIQVTHGQNGWHPHVHLIVDTAFVFLPALKAAWKKINHNAGDNIAVRDCRDRSRLREAVRYVSKPSSVARWSGAQIAAFCDALEGVRCFGVFGSLFKQRAAWSEFKNNLPYHKPACECGHDKFEYFTQNEWDAELLRIQIALTPIRGPNPTFAEQVSLPFGKN